MSAVLRWEEPPATSDRPVRLLDYEGIAHDLRERPGEWALVAVGPGHTGTAGHISSARARCFKPAGSFEARRQQVGEEIRVYARYVGVFSESSSCVA